MRITLIAAFLVLILSSIILCAASGVIVSFAAPGAAFTYPFAINANGTVAGYFQDSHGITHGFLRDASSTLTIVDEPDADTTQPGRGTSIAAVNDLEQATGEYSCPNADGTLVVCGFVRDQLGNYTSFIVPNMLGTTPSSINNAGVIAGLYVPPSTNGFEFGFIRDAAGNITTFAPPHANAMNSVAMNASSQIAGSYRSDVDNGFHAFVRSASGNIKTFDGPQAVDTFATAINNDGTVVGNYYGSSGAAHGYFRTAQGTFTSFDVPGAGVQGTYPVGINAAGTIAGIYVDAKTVNHGFVRDPSGTITTFDAPNAGNKINFGTIPTCINRTGQIAGLFYTNDGRIRAFLRR